MEGEAVFPYDCLACFYLHVLKYRLNILIALLQVLL